jgi:hypothetical protein
MHYSNQERTEKIKPYLLIADPEIFWLYWAPHKPHRFEPNKDEFIKSLLVISTWLKDLTLFSQNN